MAKTPAAEAAKMIRRELKEAFPGIKFTVRSKTYSGGDSVNVSWFNGPTQTDVEDVIKKYQQGHFDGMYDMYEMSNSRKDIPQVKFVFADRNYTTDIEYGVRQRLEAEFGLASDASDREWMDRTGRARDNMVRIELADQDLQHLPT